MGPHRMMKTTRRLTAAHPLTDRQGTEQQPERTARAGQRTSSSRQTISSLPPGKLFPRGGRWMPWLPRLASGLPRLASGLPRLASGLPRLASV
jgi:X-X-X-Leu-X-X-Gly heptad repeat protein